MVNLQELNNFFVFSWDENAIRSRNFVLIWDTTDKFFWKTSSIEDANNPSFISKPIDVKSVTKSDITNTEKNNSIP